MSDDERILQLLQVAMESDRPPEEACAGRPDLLPEVRRRWDRCRRVDEEINALFPPAGTVPDSAGTTVAAAVESATAVESAAAAGLPRIPGYEVEAVLGRGGVGVVYRARHLRLRRPVALKMLLAGRHAGRVERARFLREARAVAGLRHPHVVQVYDVGECGGLPYFTMELVDGGTLGQRLAGVPQPAGRAAELVATLARAVQAAHDAGIVHRDLKPGNVLVAADGTPKITDFGLARQAGDDQALTGDGAGMGTPSYMAPEQATGPAAAVGPRADVYSLGAILYELLTGRPPFRAATAAETLQQVVGQDPAPPSRLNARVPRDLETVCLKCLGKESGRRYPTAAALADDLTRFREGRPTHARPPTWAGRAWRWGRRNPVAAALVATAFALVGLAVGGGFWVQRQRAEARAAEARQEGRTWQAVEAALDQAAVLQALGRWPEARAALKGAPTLLGTAAPAALSDRLRQARADADMVTALEEVRLRLSEGRKVEVRVSPTVDRLYDAAFAAYGVAPTAADPAGAADRVRRSPIRLTLLVFLHDWLYWAPDEHRDRLRAVVDLADDDPWRRDYRDALAAKDDGIDALATLAAAPEAAAQPPVILSGLGGTLLAVGRRDEAWELLREAQRRHPGDFWINYLAGSFLEPERPRDAISFLRAAVAIRPSSDQAYTLLGRALRDTGDADGAVAAFHTAVRLNPNQDVAEDLVKVLATKGRLEEARVIWDRILQGGPPDHELWHGYAELCLFLGHDRAYRQARKAMLDRFGGVTEDWVVAERTSLAGLLLPGDEEDLRRAATLADRAAAAAARSTEPDNGYVRFVQGLAEYRRGRPGRAIPLLRDAAVKLPTRPAPRLALAMAQFAAGSAADARRTLAATVRYYNWDTSDGDRGGWVNHVLRLEAETLILPRLPWFVSRDGLLARLLLEAGNGGAAGAGGGADPAAAGDADDVVATFVGLYPTTASGEALVKVLAPAGRLEEARAVWEQIMARDPPNNEPWYGYAQLCLFLGHEAAYRRARAAMLDRFAGVTDDWIVAERTSLASLLLPADGDDLRRAAVLADRASAAAARSPEPGNGYVRFVQGVAEYRQGRLAAAVPYLLDAAEKIPHRPGPRLVLAMIQFRSGAAADARRTLAAAVRSYDWDAAQADSPSRWVSHVLRREAEGMILPDLPAFLAGRYQPHDADERIAMTGACQFLGLHAAGAGLWADALAADPGLAAAGLEPAVCATALAGCGRGRDAAAATGPDRARWRRQARDWVWGELAAADATLRQGEAGRQRLLATLTRWSTSPDLAAVRDPGGLALLAPAERAEWAALWGQVGTMLNRVRPPR